jgi:hypothetical protein
MVAVLDDLKLTELACSIPGLSPVGTAAILAETGGLHRFTSSRAVAKHAGLAPRQRLSGTFVFGPEQLDAMRSVYRPRSVGPWPIGPPRSESRCCTRGLAGTASGSRYASR